MASSAFDSGPAADERREGLSRIPLEALLRHLPGGVVVAEAPGGRLVHVNPRVERIWRRSFSDVCGVEDYGAWQGLHPDGRPLRPEEWPLARSLASGEVVDGEDVHVVRGDGTQAVVHLCSSPVRDDGGRIVAAVLTCSDVTEERRREAVRRLLAETSAALASSLDYERTLRNVACLIVPTLADWCCIETAREGEGIRRLVVEPAPGGADERRAREAGAGVATAGVLRTGEPELIPRVDGALLEALARDAAELDLLRGLAPRSAMIVPLRARERILGAIVLLGSRSRPRYGAAELEQIVELATRAALAIDNARLYHDAQAANRAKADFLAVISHELRTPLTAVIGYAELLALGVPEPVTERQKEQVERIEVSARHLLQLIEEILTMASLEAGQARVRQERVELADLLRRAAVIAQPLARAKGLELRVEPVPPELSVPSDPDKLLQVLLNLLSNAVKFTERGEIRLAARRADGALEVEVSDTGIGIAERDHRSIFEPFWQAEQPVTRQVGGTGLGLAISRRLLDLLGGEIHLESTLGRGSTFRVRLPYST